MISFSEELESLLGFFVSRETVEKFEIYKRLLIEENKKYNLVGPSTVEKIEFRHFLDSAQLYPFLLNQNKIVDVGSGAGFPGLVLAILGVSGITLMEASAKKVLFLEKVSRETSTKVEFFNGRTEQYRGDKFDVIISRAMAPLCRLFSQTASLKDKETCYVLLKGERGAEEVEVAKKRWFFTYECRKSITHKQGLILKIENVIYKNDKNHQHSKPKGWGWENNNNG